jgi:radical SAM superfamily enzyme YgiQ (UPF0313 family)
MSNDFVDVVFIAPSNARSTYQELSQNYSAIEPPTWALLLAESVRSVGWNPKIIDSLAEQLTDEEICSRVKAFSPKLVCFVVYGQNVNSGTTNMSGTIRSARALKHSNPNLMISVLGSYVQAVPMKILQDEPSIDFVFTNEGVYAIRNVLSQDSLSPNNLEGIKGIAWRRDGVPTINKSEIVVPNHLMDSDLPGYAWDLLPYAKEPLDLYRSPLWHAEYNEKYRTPYAAIQTSLGCNFGCSFCMINTINRDDEESIGVSGNYSGMRFWSPEFVLRQIDILTSLGVRTIRIVDEMFLLYRKHYVPLCEMLSKKEYASELRMWAYSRVDTVTNPEFLSLVRRAGIRWLALGIESASKKIRLEVSKGKFEDVDIRKVVEQIHESGIEVMANYIVGLPGDTLTTMNETLQLSIELCTSGWNMYPAMALPGSQLYKMAIEDNKVLPLNYEGYSFHSYETVPFASENLSGAEILKFRDNAFKVYHSDQRFLKRIEETYGSESVEEIRKMTKIDLRRKLIDQSQVVSD